MEKSKEVTENLIVFMKLYIFLEILSTLNQKTRPELEKNSNFWTI